MNDHYKSVWKINDLELVLSKMDLAQWLKYELFTWNWWLLVAFLILPWFIWFKFVHRAKIVEILLFGLLVIVITTILDILGTKLSFWVYPYQLIPFFPRALTFDMSMIPVGFMLVYQYFRTWKSFMVALVCLAFLFAFIGEPFAIWAELVIYLKWSNIYSFFYYILTGISLKFIIEKLRSLT